MPRISRSRVSAKQKELWIRKIKSPNHYFIEIFDLGVEGQISVK